MRAVFSPFFSFFTSSEGEESHAPSAVFARKSCRSLTSHVIVAGFFPLIASFNTETFLPSSVVTSNVPA
ncbi:hypothetical protein PC116_g19417 [Phytophthora cactorum]|nr:hypothetical protein PC116_g19417 [Phytophthora cactorum]